MNNVDMEMLERLFVMVDERMAARRTAAVRLAEVNDLFAELAAELAAINGDAM